MLLGYVESGAEWCQPMSPLKRTALEPVSARLDRLLGLLTSRQTWTGPALASELDVSKKNDSKKPQAVPYAVER